MPIRKRFGDTHKYTLWECDNEIGPCNNRAEAADMAVADHDRAGRAFQMRDANGDIAWAFVTKTMDRRK